MGSATAELWLWIVALAVGVGLGGCALAKLRRLVASGRPTSHQWLSQFREMHSQGLLSDQEFQSIKSTLIPQIQQEITPQANKDKLSE
ncbi:MAG: hypothetical protein NZ602_06055 [Thermoguttaceae bacterium]|nr:hypothetical protein [Thermoguttaceae bacterium]MDW8038608.1 hypothetical protein [Thermoguttaceae bacterium]